MLEHLDIWLMKLGAILLGLLGVVYIYFKIKFTYWKRRGVPSLKSRGLFGDYGSPLFASKGTQQQVLDLYDKFVGHKVGGIYRVGKPYLILRDPEIIKDVLVKDFDHFYSRGIPASDKEPLQGHLFFLSGPKWRNLRVKLTPTFTSGKMKMMFGTLLDCSKQLETVLQKIVDKSEAVEMKDLSARFTTDIIASCAFGIQCNCMENEDAEFRQWGRKIFSPNLSFIILRVISSFFPSLNKYVRISFVPKDVSNYFRRMVRETVEYREKNNVLRNDFMQLMIQLKNKTLGVADDEIVQNGDAMNGLKNNEPFEVTMDVIAAQAFVFFIAGFETSSTTMSFCLYELAVNQEIQKKVRAEIDEVLGKHDGQITYDNIFEMEYLDRVVSETLRKYPPLILITRECTNTTKLRGTDVTVEKGTTAFIPIKSLHYDPKYFPDPERFDPERFTEKEKKKRPQCSYLPFGEGPRLCIGMRFGLMQTKVGLITLLSNYEVQVSEKTPVPIVLNPKSAIITPIGGLWLNITKRSDRRK